jgi:alpha(1,3/1,4) fucosyltransferase
MKKNKQIILATEPFYHNNKIFDEKNPITNRDDFQRPYIELKKAWLKKNIDFDTEDLIDMNRVTAIIFFNIPDENNEIKKLATENNIPIYSIINELPNIHENNKKLNLHVNFKKIFTYQDSLIDNIKYFKLNYSFIFPEKVIGNFTRKGFCTLIANNKTLNYHNELYSTRKKIIYWFEKKHPNMFRFYGGGWNEKQDYISQKCRNILKKIIHCLEAKHSDTFNSLNKKLALLNNKLFEISLSTYEGKIKKKKDVLEKFRFSICLENASSEPGWITEKIFDSLFSGCVPIYQGPDNINDIIPEKCYIDFRKFKSYASMYSYLLNYSERDYRCFIDAVNKFISSKAKNIFTVKYFVNTITSNIKINYET